MRTFLEPHMVEPSFLEGLADDGLYTPEIKPHSIQKLRMHNYVSRMFATGMKGKWTHRAYIGLYCAAGRARRTDTNGIIETTTMSVLRLPDPFTHYVFVDADPRCTSALTQRVATVTAAPTPTIIIGDVNQKVDEIKRALPRYSKTETLLSFCFVDPFDATLKFRTIRSLAAHQMDFLILLALGSDVRRNLRQYFDAESNARIGDLIDDPNWREEFKTSGKRITEFVLTKFDEAMVRLGYLSSKEAHPVKVSGMGVLLYYLVFYSKHRLGLEFWHSARRGVTGQEELDLGLFGDHS